MASLNKVMLIGNLTRDPELRYTPGGAAVCEFGLACNRKWKGGDGQMQEEVFFGDVTAWGKMGENIAEYMSKGRPIFVEGYLKLDQWEKDGEKRSKVKIVALNVQFLGSGGGEGGGGGGGGQRSAGTTGRSAGGTTQRGGGDTVSRGGDERPDDDFNMDDVPF